MQPTEVHGRMLLALIENINVNDIASTLKAFGLAHINPDQWYPLQTLIDLHNTLIHQPNAASNMTAIGVKAAETAVLPPQIDTLEKLLAGYDDAYRANYRHLPEDDRYDVQFIGDRRVVVTNHTHNPNEIVYGVLWGFAKRFSKSFIVQSVDQNGNPTIGFTENPQRFEIRWEV
jgi:hypothetical protein